MSDLKYEPGDSISYKIAWAPSEDPDQLLEKDGLSRHLLCGLLHCQQSCVITKYAACHIPSTLYHSFTFLRHILWTNTVCKEALCTGIWEAITPILSYCGTRLFLYILCATHEKGLLCNLRTTQAQTSLRECAGCSGPSLSAYRNNECFRMCRRTETVQIRLHGCTRAWGPSLFSYGIRLFSLVAHNILFINNKRHKINRQECGLGGLVVCALDFQAGSDLARVKTNFQTISTPSSYSRLSKWWTGLSIKWTRQTLVIDSGTKYAWVIHESKAVQIRVHNNRRCLYVPRVLGSVKIRTSKKTSSLPFRSEQ